MQGTNIGTCGRRVGVAGLLALSITSFSAQAITVDGDLTDLINTVGALNTNVAQGTDPNGTIDGTEAFNGSDIENVYAYYDFPNDTLYLGLSVYGSVGTSGDLEGLLGGQAGVFDSWESYGFDIRYPANSATQLVRFDVIGEDVDGFGTPAFGSFSTNPFNMTVDWAVSVGNNGVEFSVSGLLAALGTLPKDVTFSFYAGSGTNTLPEDMAQLNMQVVPVPAAVWLFGSGLLGLLGMARRRS